MNTQIIIDEHGDLDLFNSEDEVLKYIEPIDIKNNEYEIYDKNGFKFKATIEEKIDDLGCISKLLRIKKYNINLVLDTRVNFENKLKNKIINFMERVNSPVENNNIELSKAILLLKDYLNK